jgi:hypothetical protein
MDNPETLVTLEHKTQGEDKKKLQKHNTTWKIKKMSNTDPTKIAVNPGAREG